MSDARAAVITVYRAPFTVETFPRPEPQPGALVVDIGAATVCGPDVHVRAGDLERRLPITAPLILGRETAGRVGAVGALP